MRLEQVIRSTMTEAMDMDGRLDQLVRAGLMPTSSLPLLKRAISRMHAGMSLQGAERDVMNMFISSMMFIVLGDDTVFNKARAGAKSYATEAKEKTEYDYEGDMAMGQLKSIIANSQRMHDMLSDDTNLPEWVQSKITLAEDYISTASNYMQGEMNESKDDMPFEGPYRKVGDRKDKYGNPIKNVAKHLAKKAMNAQKNEEVEQIDEILPLVAGAAARYAAGKAGAGAVGRTVAGAATKYAVSKSMKKEEVEQVDELSKATMGRYINKAATKMGSQGVTAGLKIAADEKSSKNFKDMGKREKGIKLAVKKLTKEDIEQVDEISKATLGSYVKKASGAEQPKNVMSPKNVPLTKIAAYQGDSETGHFGKRFNQHTYDKAERLRKNRETGIKRAVDKLTKEDVELDEGNTTPEIKKAYADLIKTPSGSSERKTAIRHYKSLRQNLAKEEVEQVDEVSKRTLGRYINKAKDSIDMTSYRSGIKDGTAISSSTPYKSNNPLEKKLSKRHKGIETAVKKLTKEDIDAVKKMNESYKTAFESALNEYGIKSPSELDESKRKEFFNHVDLEFKKGDN
jgi:hypothetical protein